MTKQNDVGGVDDGKLWSFLHDRLHEIHKSLRECGGREDYHAMLDGHASKLADEVASRFLASPVAVGHE